MDPKSLHIWAVILSCTLFMSCSHQPIIYPDGGYDYPKDINNIDSNNIGFPISHLIGTKDSFMFACFGRFWMQAYSEPNLSLKPMAEDVFRLHYEDRRDEFIFKMTSDEIVVKERVKGRPYPEYDSTKLDDIERRHYVVLNSNFPLQDKKNSGKRKKMLDSLVMLYPQLLDPSYYRSLLEKSFIKSKEAFTFSTRKIKISKSKFHHIVNLINSSGYWKLPYRNECETAVADGYGLTLEANTSRRYNMAGMGYCPGVRKEFINACQELINASQLSSKIKL